MYTAAPVRMMIPARYSAAVRRSPPIQYAAVSRKRRPAHSPFHPSRSIPRLLAEKLIYYT